MHGKEYTVAIFLNIEGAFNKVDQDAIVSALGSQPGTESGQNLWNLAVNSLLRGLKYSGNDATAYTDDIAIAASGICPPRLPDELNLALSIVLDWCREFGLSINSSKTDTIRFFRRYKILTSLLSICGVLF